MNDISSFQQPLGAAKRALHKEKHMRTSAKQAAIRLKALGFEVLSVSEPNDDEDGEIKISDMVHVQVGYDHINVVKQHGEGDNLSFEFWLYAF